MTDSLKPPGALTAPEYLAKVEADPHRAAALDRARQRAAAPSGPTLTDEDVEKLAMEHGEAIYKIGAGLVNVEFTPEGFRAAVSAVLARVAAAPSMQAPDSRLTAIADEMEKHFGAEGWDFPRIKKLAGELRALAAAPAVQPPPGRMGCACQWEGNEYVQRCDFHDAWHTALHEWADRAKAAEKIVCKLVGRASPSDPHRGRSNEGRWKTLNVPIELFDRASILSGISASGGTPEGERAAETQSGEVQR